MTKFDAKAESKYIWSELIDSGIDGTDLIEPSLIKAYMAGKKEAFKEEACGSNQYLPKNIDRSEMAIKLRKRGLSLRMIAKAMGFKSPNTVLYYIRRFQAIRQERKKK